MIFYILIALVATILGAISGMAGGVIMKPFYDLIGDFVTPSYTVQEISVITSCTAFAMAIVSAIKQRRSALSAEKAHAEGEITEEEKNETPKIIDALTKKTILFLGLSSIVGGVIGELIFSFSTASLDDNMVKMVQNIVLIVMIVVIIIYMTNRNRIKTLDKRSPLAFCMVGLSLGIVSSFLGIGGGPLNVAILVYVCGFSPKTATFGSLVTIIFAQFSKLITMIVTNGFMQFAIITMPFVVIAGIVGAFIGSYIAKKVSQRGVVILFNIVQVLILAICVFNVVLLLI